MSTEQEASDTNGQQGQPANKEPAGVPPPPAKWARFAPRTPTNQVARPSERGGDRRDGHGGHNGRRPQRPPKHHQRGGVSQRSGNAGTHYDKTQIGDGGIGQYFLGVALADR